MTLLQSRLFGRAFITGVVLAILATIVATAWQLRPVVRAYCIREGVLGREPANWWPKEWKQEIRIRKKLLDPVTFEFIDTPLSDPVDFLADFTGERIVLEEDALARLGFDKSIPVSVHVKQTTLRSALRLMLSQVKLSFLIENGSLVITSKTEAQSRTNSFTSPATPGIGLESLQSSDLGIRTEAAFALGCGRPRADLTVPELIGALKDDSRIVRVDAAFALGEMGHEAALAVPALEKLLEGENDTLRVCALAALSNMGSLKWEKALRGTDDRLADFAVKYLYGSGTEGEQGVIHRAVGALRSEDAELRRRAAWTLSAFHVHARSATLSLSKLLDDSDGRVRLAAAQALWKIDRLPPETTTKLIEVLNGAVTDGDPKSGSFSPTRREILTFFLLAKHLELPDVETLIELLSNRDYLVRKLSAELLGKHGTDASAAMPALTRLLDQSQPEVRLQAATALLRIGPPNERVVEELVDLLHDKDEHVHVRAIELLGQCGKVAVAAIPEIKAIIQTQDRRNDRRGKIPAAERAMQRIWEAMRQDELHKQTPGKP